MAGEGIDDPHAVKLKVIWHTNAGSLLFFINGYRLEAKAFELLRIG